MELTRLRPALQNLNKSTLEEHWELNSDGGFERQRTSTLGILILSKDIEHLEFFRFEQQQTTYP